LYQKGILEGIELFIARLRCLKMLHTIYRRIIYF